MAPTLVQETKSDKSLWLEAKAKFYESSISSRMKFQVRLGWRFFNQLTKLVTTVTHNTLKISNQSKMVSFFTLKW